MSSCRHLILLILWGPVSFFIHNFGIFFGGQELIIVGNINPDTTSETICSQSKHWFELDEYVTDCEIYNLPIKHTLRELFQSNPLSGFTTVVEGK